MGLKLTSSVVQESLQDPNTCWMMANIGFLSIAGCSRVSGGGFEVSPKWNDFPTSY